MRLVNRRPGLRLLRLLTASLVYTFTRGSDVVREIVVCTKALIGSPIVVFFHQYCLYNIDLSSPTPEGLLAPRICQSNVITTLEGSSDVTYHPRPGFADVQSGIIGLKGHEECAVKCVIDEMPPTVHDRRNSETE
jgi:hypothetical protein